MTVVMQEKTMTTRERRSTGNEHLKSDCAKQLQDFRIFGAKKHLSFCECSFHATKLLFILLTYWCQPREQRHRHHNQWKFSDRFTSALYSDPSKTTCTMYLQADHLFYQKFNSDMDVVIEQLTQHVQAVNDIYRSVGQSLLISSA